MSHVAYLVAGYGLSAAVLGAYAAWVIGRERSLARDLGVTSSVRRRPPVSTESGPPAE